MTKFALPALVFLVFALFYASVTSPPDEEEVTAPPVQQAQKPPTVAEASPVREPRPAEAVDGVRAELKALSDGLKRLSDDTKANSDKIAQAATLRSDLQDSRSSNDKAAQTMTDQVDALRSDQAKFMQAAKEASDRTAQDLRKEIADSQARLAAQFSETMKAGTARSETLAQRVDAIRKDVDDIKKTIADDRQNASNISPGLALVVALAALVLGPFVARQLTANQIAAARKQAEAEAAVARAAKAPEAEPPLAPSVAADLHQETLHRHDTSPSSGEAAPDKETGSHSAHDTTNPEKV